MNITNNYINTLAASIYFQNDWGKVDSEEGDRRH